MPNSKAQDAPGNMNPILYVPSCENRKSFSYNDLLREFCLDVFEREVTKR